MKAVKIADLLEKIYIGDLQNIKQECYQLDGHIQCFTILVQITYSYIAHSYHLERSTISPLHQPPYSVSLTEKRALVKTSACITFYFSLRNESTVSKLPYLNSLNTTSITWVIHSMCNFLHFSLIAFS
jgi:hypothetical protein